MFKYLTNASWHPLHVPVDMFIKTHCCHGNKTLYILISLLVIFYETIYTDICDCACGPCQSVLFVNEGKNWTLCGSIEHRAYSLSENRNGWHIHIWTNHLSDGCVAISNIKVSNNAICGVPMVSMSLIVIYYCCLNPILGEYWESLCTIHRHDMPIV